MFQVNYYQDSIPEKYKLMYKAMTKSYLYISAFESIATGRPVHIPTQIDAEYLKTAEEIISISYTQSEKFSSVSTCT